MRLIALLMLPSFLVAAPVPKPEKSDVELILSAKNQHVLDIIIHNNGKETLEIPYNVTPLEHFSVELRGEKGKKSTMNQFGEAGNKVTSNKLSIPAGKSKTLSVHPCHYLLDVIEPGDAVTFTVSLKLEGKTIESKPLTVGR